MMKRFFGVIGVILAGLAIVSCASLNETQSKPSGFDINEAKAKILQERVERLTPQINLLTEKGYPNNYSVY